MQLATRPSHLLLYHGTPIQYPIKAVDSEKGTADSLLIASFPARKMFSSTLTHRHRGVAASLTSIVFDKFLQTRGPPPCSGSLPGSKLQDKANPLWLLRAVLLAMLREKLRDMLRDMLRRLRDMLRDGGHRMVSCRRLGDVLLVQAPSSEVRLQSFALPPEQRRTIHAPRPLPADKACLAITERFHYQAEVAVPPNSVLVVQRNQAPRADGSPSAPSGPGRVDSHRCLLREVHPQIVSGRVATAAFPMAGQVLQPERYIRHAERPTIKHQLEEYLEEVVGAAPDQWVGFSDATASYNGRKVSRGCRWGSSASSSLTIMSM